MTSVVVNSSQQQQSMGGQPGVYRPLPNQYYPSPTPAASQQSSNTNVVIANQPAPVGPVLVTTVHTEKPSAATFIVTIMLMSLCSFLGMWHLLFCFVPALVLSVVGFNYGHSKSSEELRSQARVFTLAAAGLDIAAMVTFTLSLVIAAIVVPVVVSNQISRSYYY